LARKADAEQGSGSFLKKSTKKLLPVSAPDGGVRCQCGKSSCFFFQKEALPYPSRGQ
jgi:hypothetical protein